LRHGCEPQIRDAIVCSDAVDVINFAGRHFTVREQPRQSVRQVSLTVDGNHHVAAVV
jgi:hypothetical protein